MRYGSTPQLLVAAAVMGLLSLSACSNKTTFGKSKKAKKAAVSEPNSETTAEKILATVAETVSVSVATAAELPSCDDSREGQLIYVEETSEFQVCKDGAFVAVAIKGEKGDPGENGDGSAATPVTVLESFSYEVAQTGSDDHLVFDKTGAPLLTLTEGTWQIFGACSMLTEINSDGVALGLWDVALGKAFAISPGGATTTPVITTPPIRHAVETTTLGVITVPVTGKLIRLVGFRNGASNLVMCSGSGTGANPGTAGGGNIPGGLLRAFRLR